MIMQMLLSCLCADGQNSVSEIAVFSSQILKKCGCAFTQNTLWKWFIHCRHELLLPEGKSIYLFFYRSHINK